MTEQLKPCPFCGGEPFKLDCEQGWHLECANDDCISQPALSGFHHRYENAVKAWNTRHIPEGYQMVPIEPTSNMRRASMQVNDFIPSYDESADFNEEIYKAMLAAAGDQDEN